MINNQVSLFGDSPEWQKWNAEWAAKAAAKQEAVELEALKHPSHTFYFCGKIEKHDWREDILTFEPRGEPYPLNAYRRGQVLCIDHGVDPGLHYCGPYFIGCDHGCYHGENTHGAGLKKQTCDCENFDHGREPLICKRFTTEVKNNCLTSIRYADIIFAWITDLTAYGSLAELGYAHAQGKAIWIGWPKPLKDLWFVETMADATVVADSAVFAFQSLLMTQLKRTFRRYLPSPLPINPSLPKSQDYDINNAPF